MVNSFACKSLHRFFYIEAVNIARLLSNSPSPLFRQLIFSGCIEVGEEDESSLYFIPCRHHFIWFPTDLRLSPQSSLNRTLVAKKNTCFASFFLPTLLFFPDFSESTTKIFLKWNLEKNNKWVSRQIPNWVRKRRYRLCLVSKKRQFCCLSFCLFHWNLMLSWL